MNRIEIEKKVRQYNGVEYLEHCLCTESNNSDALRVMNMMELLSFHPKAYMHNHSFNIILWIINGKGIHHIDHQKYEINEDAIYFLSTKNLHSFESLNCCEGYAIIFTPDFLDHIDQTIIKYFRHIFFNRKGGQYCLVPIAAKGHLKNILFQMEEEQRFNSGNFISKSYLASLLTMFIATAKRMCQWPDQQESNALITSQSFKVYSLFLKEVENNFTQLHSVKEYAKLLGISICLLSRYTQEHERCTPHGIIRNRIIAESKWMLRYTPLRIKEIANNLGFKDISYFNKYFKRYAGVLPSEFRN